MSIFDAEEQTIARGRALLEEWAEPSERRSSYETLYQEYLRLYRHQQKLLKLSNKQEQRLIAMTDRANQAAAAAEAANKQLSERNERLGSLSKKLSRYLSPQVYSSIFEGEQEVRIEGRRRKLTVFFSDIAGFTSTTDRMEPEELTGLLNHYLTEMSRIALEHGATIDKFIGDAVMAFFGDPTTRGAKEDAVSAVRMALAMQARMLTLQQQWADDGLPFPFRIRIGINTGWCTVGNFGSEERMDYTAIGSEVNLAARLESVGQPDQTVISYPTYCLVKHVVECEEFKEVEVKGFAYPIRTYKAIRMISDPLPEGHARRQSAGAHLESELAKLRDGDPQIMAAALERLLRDVKGEASRLLEGDDAPRD